VRDEAAAEPGDAVEFVRRMYDLGPGREWERAERHRTEFAVTRRALAEHLPPPPARVLDCGGGPGRYAIELARQGYDVTLFDLSAECLRLAQEKAEEAGVTLAAYEHGTATDLSRFPDESFDALLSMGPLYHLLEEAQRVQALREARRVLKPGGVLFVAFITRQAALRSAALLEPYWPLEEPDLLELIIGAGQLPPGAATESGFVAYFAHPREVVPLCRGQGFEVRTVLGVEGLVSMIEEQVNALDGPAWEAWVDLNWRLAPDPSLHGGVEHLLVVAYKPRWRAVLREIARRLAQAGVSYTLVGGASAALHGVPIPVRDLDLETNAEGAYRFQALFPEQVVEPVALRQDETLRAEPQGTRYRSHFGRFDFDGVSVEVMGELQRREGERWVPTAARTQTTVELEGVAVRVSWLEEETLAYIRRGRLERAAECLPHCDRGHLLALLRGEQAMGVL
jgi:S-adenosylmethionine-dependent methyltransferase